MRIRTSRTRFDPKGSKPRLESLGTSASMLLFHAARSGGCGKAAEHSCVGENAESLHIYPLHFGLKIIQHAVVTSFYNQSQSLVYITFILMLMMSLQNVYISFRRQDVTAGSDFYV